MTTLQGEHTGVRIPRVYQSGNLVRRRALRGQPPSPAPIRAPKRGIRLNEIFHVVPVRQAFHGDGPVFAGGVRPRNGCALPDDIPDKEDSP
ncbi:hypothetical protein [Burkholderia sp. MSMB0856]|uniref:hypothetical protein n=1 Tax=Burkholderia sp. MSMB0856 TaxID=1637869 RepID=UPI00131EF220|nr:hypothetical protein [Burkholderia sp. MSMB0856]